MRLSEAKYRVKHGYQALEWSLWGLSVKNYGGKSIEHDRVSLWLSKHPEDWIPYWKRESGYRYYDILKKAEDSRILEAK